MNLKKELYNLPLTYCLLKIEILPNQTKKDFYYNYNRIIQIFLKKKEIAFFYINIKKNKKMFKFNDFEINLIIEIFIGYNDQIKKFNQILKKELDILLFWNYKYKNIKKKNIEYFNKKNDILKNFNKFPSEIQNLFQIYTTFKLNFIFLKNLKLKIFKNFVMKAPIFNKNLNNFKKLEYLIFLILQKNNFKIYQSQIYIKRDHSLYSYKYLNEFEILKKILLNEDLFFSYKKLINKYFTKFCLQNLKYNSLDNTTLSNFRYVEYNDFILDIKTSKLISKDNFSYTCFRFFNITRLDTHSCEPNIDHEILRVNARLPSTKVPKKYMPYYTYCYNFRKMIGKYFFLTYLNKSKLCLYFVNNKYNFLALENILQHLYGENLVSRIDCNKDITNFFKIQKKKKFIILINFNINTIDKSILKKILNKNFIILNENYKINKQNKIIKSCFGVSRNDDYYLNLKNPIRETNWFFTLIKKYHIILSNFIITIMIDVSFLILHSIIAFHSIDFQDWKNKK